MTRPVPIIAGTLAALVLLFGAYMGAYYLMLRDRLQDGNIVGPLPWRVPLYWVEHDFVASVFKPAHQLDCVIRRTYWYDEANDPFRVAP